MEKAWKIWKTIKLGTFDSVEQLCKAIEQSGSIVHSSVDVLFSQTKLAVERRSIDLVVVSVKDLRFSKPTEYAKILKRAQREGLKECPAEVGLQLRLQYPEQPEGEIFLIGMAGIQDETSHDIGRYCLMNEPNNGEKSNLAQWRTYRYGLAAFGQICIFYVTVINS